MSHEELAELIDCEKIRDYLARPACGEDLGEPTDWSSSLMGMPFDAEQYAGRAVEDPGVVILPCWVSVGNVGA